ncbi:uncharacterized protein LOC126882068 [Diabrotica virgifera virgifera]|uniref:Uncharacterized protein n=1 Tax=Diabrotica virgifera virgifera TaxID=50390 RepID=A0ABM5JY29_DIAVI|nr:uncharacterized protein LOC126882068 [Diabrotica virgifera virgifera]XP_050502848.1 uncharacterized protein LOC126882068 [Diabrotica virgifera virgifera]
MEEGTDFITEFHNIKGDLIGDRKANFFKLLRTPSLFSSEIQLDSTLKCLKPTTYQEQLFYLETLIYFKRTNELLDIFQQGNEIFTSKILKQQWFVESAFNGIEVDWFVNDLLPCLSFSVKKKLIPKIARCWNEEKLDVLFDKIYLKYGISLALPILIKCSVFKIQSVIEENDLKLRTVQVLQLYDKCEDLFLLYLNHINCLTSFSYNDKIVLNHIAKKNPKLILKLEQCKKIRISKFGKRMSKILMNSFGEGIPFDLQHYLPILNTSIFIRKLGRDFDPVMKKKFPLELININFTAIDRWLKYYPKKRKWEIFTQTCFEKYSDVDLNKLLLHLDHYWLVKLNAPTNIFPTWAELNYRGKYTRFLEYYELYRAIGIIKDKIQSEKSERKSLVIFLISLCRNKHDLTALDDVLEYICTTYKNQNVSIAVLQALQSWSYCENFNENIWRYINELICYLKDQNALEFNIYKRVFQHQLAYLVRSKKEYKAELLYYIQNVEIQRFSVVGFYLNDNEVCKTIYIDICKTICEPNYTCSVNISHALRAYLLAVLNFSLKNPNHRINIMEFEKFLPIIDDSFKKTKNFNYEDLQLIPVVILYNIKFADCAVPLKSNFLALMYCITHESKSLDVFSSVLDQILTEDRTPIVTDTIYYYFEHLFPDYPKVKIIDWFLTYEPDTLACYVSYIYMNFGLLAGVIEYSILEFTTHNRNKLANEMLHYYFENVFEYHPSEDLVDWFIKNEPGTLQPYFHKILESDVIGMCHLLLIKQYSHLGFDSEISKFYENKIEEDIDDKFPFIDKLRIMLSTDDFVKLVNERYLPKKDKLNLEDEEMCEIYNLQCEVAKILAKVHEPYKMLPTIMKFCRGDYLQSALRSLYKAFYRSPEKLLYPFVEALAKQAVSPRKHAMYLSCEVLNKLHSLNMLVGTNERNISSNKYHFSATLKFFVKNSSPDLLEKVFECMDKTNKNDFETMESLCEAQVPRRYSGKYIEHCWKFFENVECQGVNIDQYLKTLINSLLNAMVEHLTTNFVTYIIERYFPVKILELADFAVLVLFKRPSDRIQNMNLLFQKIPELSSKSKSHFVKQFISYARRAYASADIVSHFYNNWMQQVGILNSFFECISLKLLLLKIETNSIDQYASGVVDYLEGLTQDFEYHAYPYFRLAFRDTLQYMESEDKYTFFLNVIKYRITPITCIFVLDVMREFTYNNVPTEKARGIYQNVLEIIRLSDIPVVQIYYKNNSWKFNKS